MNIYREDHTLNSQKIWENVCRETEDSSKQEYRLDTLRNNSFFAKEQPIFMDDLVVMVS